MQYFMIELLIVDLDAMNSLHTPTIYELMTRRETTLDNS